MNPAPVGTRVRCICTCNACTKNQPPTSGVAGEVVRVEVDPHRADDPHVFVRFDNDPDPKPVLMRWSLLEPVP